LATSDFAPLDLVGDLDGDTFADAGVMALVHAAHGAFADQTANEVAVGQGLANQSVGIGIGRGFAFVDGCVDDRPDRCLHHRRRVVHAAGRQLDQLALLDGLGADLGLEESAMNFAACSLPPRPVASRPSARRTFLRRFGSGRLD
jgi:hypothetical protein